MSKLLRMIVFAIVFSVSMSCTSPKSMIMFQSANQAESTLSLPPVYEQAINVGDNLSIQINTLSKEASALFNAYAPTSQGDQSGLSISPAEGRGYRVDREGNITIAVIGKVKVEGLTNSMAEKLIQEKLKQQFDELTVSVRNLSFRILVLGEVARPGYFPINGEQITLPEALGLAGDITIYGRRTNVMVIREERGRKTFTKIDMTRRGFFQSPYYYLHSSDVIYVEPSKNRFASTDRIYVIAPLLVGTLTSLAIFFTRF